MNTQHYQLLSNNYGKDDQEIYSRNIKIFQMNQEIYSRNIKIFPMKHGPLKILNMRKSINDIIFSKKHGSKTIINKRKSMSFVEKANQQYILMNLKKDNSSKRSTKQLTSTDYHYLFVHKLQYEAVFNNSSPGISIISFLYNNQHNILCFITFIILDTKQSLNHAISINCINFNVDLIGFIFIVKTKLFSLHHLCLHQYSCMQIHYVDNQFDTFSIANDANIKTTLFSLYQLSLHQYSCMQIHYVDDSLMEYLFDTLSIANDVNINTMYFYYVFLILLLYLINAFNQYLWPQLLLNNIGYDNIKTFIEHQLLLFKYSLTVGTITRVFINCGYDHEHIYNIKQL